MTEGRNALAFQKPYKNIFLILKKMDFFLKKMTEGQNALAFQKLYKKQIFNLKKNDRRSKCVSILETI